MRRGELQTLPKPWEAGDDVFVTTTCLDFAHLFARPEMRSALQTSLLDDLRHYRVVLHAYVVMTHHVHFVVRTPPNLDPQAPVQLLKKNATDRLGGLLEPSELAQLSQQAGLNHRRMWRRSFRLLVLHRDKTFMQKIGYIHENPLRASLCQWAEAYPWSSARAFVERRWTWEDGCLEACLEHAGLAR